MIVLPDTKTFDSSIRLVQLVGGVTKVNMLKVCDKLDLYVSPNLKKDETGRRVAQELLDSPIEILSNLNKQELQIIDEFVKGGANTYVVLQDAQDPVQASETYTWLPPIAMRKSKNGTCSCPMNCVRLCQAITSSILTWLRKVRKDLQLSSSA